jgi:hypothetical protein
MSSDYPMMREDVQEAVTHGVWVPQCEKARLYKMALEQLFERFSQDIQLLMCRIYREEVKGQE